MSDEDVVADGRALYYEVERMLSKALLDQVDDEIRYGRVVKTAAWIPVSTEILRDLALPGVEPHPAPEVVQVDLVLENLQKGRCNTCRWWVRDTPGRFYPAEQQAQQAEWGTCQVATDPTWREQKAGVPVELTEARSKHLAHATADGYDVESFGLNTRSNFGCVAWEAQGATGPVC